jgi:hypothetical protein
LEKIKERLAAYAFWNFSREKITEIFSFRGPTTLWTKIQQNWV